MLQCSIYFLSWLILAFILFFSFVLERGVFFIMFLHCWGHQRNGRIEGKPNQAAGMNKGSWNSIFRTKRLDAFPSTAGRLNRLQLWITTFWGQLHPSLALLTTGLDAVFDYIQQTVTAVSSPRRHTLLIYVNEIYSPFTSAWQSYSSLKSSSSFQWKKLFWRGKWDVWILQVFLLNGWMWLVCTVLGRGVQTLPFLITLRFWELGGGTAGGGGGGGWGGWWRYARNSGGRQVQQASQNDRPLGDIQ